MNKTIRILIATSILFALIMLVLVSVEASEQTIQPVNVVDIHGEKYEDDSASIHVTLGLREGNDLCHVGTPQVVVAIQFYPTIGEPLVTNAAPGNPCGDIEWRAAEQFASSLWLYMDSNGQEVAVGPIEGLYTSWGILYHDLLAIEYETMGIYKVYAPAMAG